MFSMKIVVFSRLTKEKNIPRLVAFAKKVESFCTIDFYGFGDESLVKNFGPNLIFKGSDPNAKDRLREYDFLALLSDTEGYPYSVVEALSQSVPVIVTPFEEASSMVVDGVDGYIIPFDLDTFDFEKLKVIPKPTKFVPKTTPETWIKYFNNHLKNKIPMKRKIKIIGENITFNIGEVVEVSQKRADRAVRMGIAEYVGADVEITFVESAGFENVPTVTSAENATPDPALFAILPVISEEDQKIAAAISVEAEVVIADKEPVVPIAAETPTPVTEAIEDADSFVKDVLTADEPPVLEDSAAPAKKKNTKPTK